MTVVEFVLVLVLELQLELIVAFRDCDYSDVMLLGGLSA